MYKNDSLENELIEIHVLELPKFKTTESKKISKKEAWMAFLNGDDKVIKYYNEIRMFDCILDKYWKFERRE